MKKPSVIYFVTKHLDLGLSSITPEQKERLSLARQTALERRKISSQIRWAGVFGFLHVDLLSQRVAARTAFAMVFVAFMSFWHADRYIQEVAELDSAILSDEMPMDVFTDKGFDQWMKSSGGQ